MNAVNADVFNNGAYATPQAELLDSIQQTPVRDKLFSRQGRIGILAFHARFLLGLSLMIVGSAPVIAMSVLGDEASFNGVLAIASAVLAFAGIVSGMLIMLISTFKRLHDLGKSSWYWLISLIPIVGTFFAIYYMFFRGKAEANNYGLPRESSLMERIFGYIGMCVVVGLLIFSAVDAVMNITGSL